jgi:putative ABC transport system substrate-binding protein
MRRIGLAVVLTVSLTLAPLAAEAQSAKRIPRIGVLAPASSVPLATFEAFRQGLRDLGYVEGQSIAIEWRFAEGRYELFPEFARGLAALKVDVILAEPTAAAQAAREAAPTVPVVMVAVHDPVGSGLVSSLARPGGNVTGLSLLTPDLVAKQLELLKEAVPGISRVAILRNPASSPHAALVKETERAGRMLGLRLEVLGTSSFRSCTRFAMRSGVKWVTPVTLPPGCARLAMTPDSTG